MGWHHQHFFTKALQDFAEKSVPTAAIMQACEKSANVAAQAVEQACPVRMDVRPSCSGPCQGTAPSWM